MSKRYGSFTAVDDLSLDIYKGELFCLLGGSGSVNGLVFLRGSPRDLYHPAWVCEQVHERLPNAQLADPPWPIDIFADRMNDGKGLFSDWPMLAPMIDQFMGAN